MKPLPANPDPPGLVMSDQHQDQNAPDGLESEARASKSSQKKHMRELQDTGGKLLTLPKARLAELPLPEDLLKALAEGRRLKHADAVRRQIRYIAKLIKNADHESIVTALAQLEEDERLFRQRFQQVEALAERLGTGDPDLLEQVLAEYPGLERQRLRQLIRQVLRQHTSSDNNHEDDLRGTDNSDQQRTSNARRKLFDYLRENLKP